MSTSLLYHAFGIQGYRYVRTAYVQGQTIFTLVPMFWSILTSHRLAETGFLEVTTVLKYGLVLVESGRTADAALKMGSSSEGSILFPGNGVQAFPWLAPVQVR